MQPKSYRFRLFLLAAAVILSCLLLATPSLADHGPLNEPAFHNNPSRTVMQIIDHRFYKWHEYENPADSSTYIYLLEPEEKRLSSAEAAGLLEASRQWENQRPAFQSTFHSLKKGPYEGLQVSGFDFEFSQEALNATWENISMPEGMTDNRWPVSKSDALTYPHNTIGFLTTNFQSEYMRGTGFLISPYTVLTNAHNIYSPQFGGWFESITFTPGQYETDTFEVIQPYPTASPIRAEVSDAFLKYEDDGDRDRAINHDYGAVFFGRPFSGISTFMPLQFNHHPGQISLLGYPGYVGDAATLGMWQSDGTVVKANDYCLYYEAFTSGGNSGSPVFVYNENAATYRVVAIHSFASRNFFSGGPHLNDINRNLIENWLRWVPDQTGHEDENTNSEETEAPVLSLEFEEITLEVNESKYLSVTVTPNNGEISALVWTTNHPNIAVVDDLGLVTAIGPGKTTAMVRTPDGREEAGCVVIVSDGKTVSGDKEISPDAGLPGDINHDGKVDVQDVVLVTQHVLELARLSETGAERADVNNDGVVNIIDITLIMQHAVGMIDSF